jgi:hypothetical protein
MMMSLDLMGVLRDAGVERLHEGSKEISGACPQHEVRTGKPDRHPSWSINKFSYLFFCQACQYKGTLTSLLTDLLGSAPQDIERDLKQQSFLRTMGEVRGAPSVVLDPVAPILTEWMLKYTLTEPPQRLLNFRQLRQAAIATYEVRWNRDTRQWVMPLRSPTGTLLGAQYKQQGSVLTLPEGIEKSTTLFGYSVMSQYDHAALVESPLDAVRLFGLGVPAVSSLGAHVSEAQCRLLARAFSVVYMALDNDKAGREGASYASSTLRRFGAAPIPWDYSGLVDEEGKRAKDVGDVALDADIIAAWQRTRRCGW